MCNFIIMHIYYVYYVFYYVYLYNFIMYNYIIYYVYYVDKSDILVWYIKLARKYVCRETFIRDILKSTDDIMQMLNIYLENCTQWDYLERFPSKLQYSLNVFYEDVLFPNR